jgi:hypothetical protein
MSRLLSSLAVLALATLAVAPSAAAQRPLDPPIDYSYLSLPSDFSTQLRQSNKTFEGSYFDRYAVRMRAGQVAVVTVESSDFDPKLVIGPLGDRFGRTDDDGGGGTSARLTARFERDTTLVVMVHSYGERQTGTYRIRISEPPRMPDSGRWSDALDPTDALAYFEDADEEYLSDFLWFEARAGEPITVQLASSEVDVLLRIRASDGRVLAEDDDGGGGTDARLDFTAPASGRYQLEVTTALPFEVGEYSLTMARARVAPAAGGTDIIPIAIGASVRGEITAGDSRDCGQYPPCDRYAFEASYGERFTITMVAESGGIDPVLVLLDPTGTQVAINDDDPTNGWNARIDIAVRSNGRFRIIARTLGGTGTGPYVLTVRRAP